MSTPSPAPSTPPPGWSPFERPGELERFWALSIAAASAAGEVTPHFELGMIDVITDDGPTSCGLSNIAQICAQHPSDQWNHIISNHFDFLRQREMMDKIDTILDSERRAAPHLRVRLVQTPIVEEFDVHRLDLSQGVSLALAIDVDGHTTYVGRERLERWQRTDNELLMVGAEQVRQHVRVRSRSRSQFGGRHLRLASSSMFLTGHIFGLDAHIPSDWHAHGALIAAPTAREMIAVPVVNGPEMADRVAAGLASAYVSWCEGPNSLSTDLWWWRPTHDLEPAVRLVNGRVKVTAQGELAEIMEGTVAQGDAADPS